MTNNKIKNTLAVASFVMAITFGFCGLFLPPMGSITPSVLIWLAQLLVFCAMLLGFSASENAILKEITEILKEMKG